ncbi:conserved hypothetical protein [Luteimonas sp. 9C]|uniref:FHA domain-containing protein n=1 Tax=Luteimonas sp. 9C TaxID=2653148 RepID=UPI0012F3A990|nr:FHA domain-containing protein [Luteimonas sp. 9C]VXB32850.1 conserved hypothetical protein [Luteimonas sp. 9C]
MKLVFSNGAHGQILLRAGVNRIGALPGSAVHLTDDGIRPLHCEIHVTDAGANLQVPAGGGPVSINGRPVSDLMALRAGDDIDIGGVMATFAPLAPAQVTTDAAPRGDDDIGATRVRAALPRFVLRGESEAVAGKLFPVTGAVVIGRAPECDITVHVDEISRRHARVKPVGDGLSVEDLDSSNGTYINAGRVQQGFLGPGDELRLDAVRFVLVAAGMDASPSPTSIDATPRPRSALRTWGPVVLTVVTVLVIAALTLAPG